MKYEVQHYTLCDGWVNCWTTTLADGTEEKTVFETFEQAVEAIADFLHEEQEAFKNGDIDSMYEADEFRIERV